MPLQAIEHLLQVLANGRAAGNHRIGHCMSVSGRNKANRKHRNNHLHMLFNIAVFG